MRKGKYFQQTALKQQDILMEKQINFTPYLTQYTKTNLRCELNVKTKLVKLGEEKIKNILITCGIQRFIK